MQLKYEIDSKEIGKRFRNVRRRLGYTQLKLAEAIGVTWKYLSKIENGAASPSLPFIIKFAEVTECDLNYLLRGIHPQSKTCQGVALEEPLIFEVYENGTSKKRLRIYKELMKAIFDVLKKNKV